MDLLNNTCDYEGQMSFFFSTFVASWQDVFTYRYFYWYTEIEGLTCCTQWQFRLAYVAPESRVVGTGVLVDLPSKIALNYLTGFFFIDFFAALPIPQVRFSSSCTLMLSITF